MAAFVMHVSALASLVAFLNELAFSTLPNRVSSATGPQPQSLKPPNPHGVSLILLRIVSPGAASAAIVGVNRLID